MNAYLKNRNFVHVADRTSRASNRYLLTGLALAISAALAIPAMAADPTVAGNTSIGTHPFYGTAYSGFWRNGVDYSILTDGSKLYLNAPNGNSTIFFRGNNWANNGVTDPDGGQSRAYIDGNSNLFVGNAITAGGMIVSRISVPAGASEVASVRGISNDGALPVGSLEAAGVQGSAFNGVGVIGNSTQGWGGMFGQDADEYYNNGIFVAGLKRAVSVLGNSLLSGDVQITKPLSPFTGSGNLSVAGNIVYNGTLTHSDRRLKKDIGDFRIGLSDLEKIHVVKYKYNGLGGTVDNGQEHVGVIAQELEKIMPFMVSAEKAKLRESDKEPTDIELVDTGALPFLIINAVQELSKQNKELSAQNVEQNKKLAELSEQNKTLAKLAEQNRMLTAFICHDHTSAAVCAQPVALAQ